MVLAELRHVGAASQCATDSELRFLMSLEVNAISLGIHVRSFDVKLTKPTAELASLLNLRPDRCVIAVVDEVFAFGLWTISEANASVNSVKARSILVCGIVRMSRQTDEAGDWARNANLLTNGGIVAMLSQVFAGGMLHVTIFAMDIESCVLWSNILADAPSLHKGRHVAFWNDSAGNRLKGVSLFATNIQGDAVLSAGFGSLCSNDTVPFSVKCGCHNCLVKGCEAADADRDLDHPHF